MYAYPADAQGNCVNPYCANAEINRTFKRTCWGSMLVSAAGHEFEFLAWYRLTSSGMYTENPPDFARAVGDIDPSRGAVGPLTATQLRRVRLELLGRIDGFEPVEPGRASVIYGVANDIAVSGTLAKFAKPGTFPRPARFR